jgi:hypothetical protein
MKFKKKINPENIKSRANKNQKNKDQIGYKKQMNRHLLYFAKKRREKMEKKKKIHRTMLLCTSTTPPGRSFWNASNVTTEGGVWMQDDTSHTT